MNPFDAYEAYISLKLHFKRWDYDYFHFNGKCHASVNAFERRKDKGWFEKLINLHSPFERLLANISLNEQVFIRDVVVETDIYLQWQARQDTLSLTFQKEIGRLKRIFNENFLFRRGSHPYLVREYLGGRISLETITIISDLTDCVSYWGTISDDDQLFEAIIRRIMKYSPFLKYDAEIFRKILIDRVED